MKSRVNILMPVKDLAFCKQRLASVLSPQERQDLVLALLESNLRVLTTDFPELDVLVITPDHTVARLAKRLGVRVLVEPVAQGLNVAIQRGTRWSLAKGYQRQLVLAPDIADLKSHELQQLFNQMDNPNVDPTVPRIGIAVAKDGGTNALFTQPPNVVEFQFGPNSAARMLSHCRQRGIANHRLHLTHLSLDIDTPEDLTYWTLDSQTPCQEGEEMACALK